MNERNFRLILYARIHTCKKDNNNEKCISVSMYNFLLKVYTAQIHVAKKTFCLMLYLKKKNSYNILS